MKVIPISIKKANNYVGTYHRHNGPVTGGKFAIACSDNEEICGICLCGRPVSRKLDTGDVLEINRLCTNGHKNACSFLYGAAARIAKEMGYRKIITYILQTEPGTSLKAAGYVLEAENVGGKFWTGKRQQNRQKQPKFPSEYKKRYVKILY